MRALVTIPFGPPHPGKFLKHTIIENNALSVTEAAQILGVTRAALSALLNERSDLSFEMALRIEKAFSLSMNELMWMQTEFDIAQVRRRENQISVSPYKPKR